MRRVRTGSRPLAISLVIGLVAGTVAVGSSAWAVPKPTDSGASARTAAKQATIALADLGPGWTQYRKAGGFRTAGKKSCDLRFGSPLRVSDRLYVGSMARDETAQAFIYSYAVVFRTKAGAKAYTAARRKSKFLDCKGAQDDAATRKANPGSFVRVDRRTDPSVGTNGLEAFYDEVVGTKDAAGAEVPGGGYARYTFRHGRVVYIVSIDAGSASDEAARQEQGARLTAALNAGTAAVEARLTKLGL